MLPFRLGLARRSAQPVQWLLRSGGTRQYSLTAPMEQESSALERTLGADLTVNALAGATAGFLEGLRNVWETILRAVPKKKTSHSKKRMRSSNKGLKNRTDIVPCPGCGRHRMMGHICRHCLRDIRHRLKYGDSTPTVA